MHNRTNKLALASALSLTALAALAVSLVASSPLSAGAQVNAPAVAGAAKTAAGAAVQASGPSLTTTQVAARGVKSVVNIATSKEIEQRLNPMLQDPFFRHFFGGRGGMRRMPKRRQTALGSGVIVRKEGIILTNNHVVEHADDVKVTLSDGREYKAKIVGTDPKSDIGVLRLVDPPKDLVALPIGDSDALELGEPVMAIGNPFGLGHTVTHGIVSAKGRANVGIVDYEDFIQTDAAINPGNSGGALLNMRGELVGINTAILSRSGGSQGIGFAIPANMAVRIMDMLVKDGEVHRGYLGAMIQDLSPRLARAMGLPAHGGVLVADVAEDGPGAKAGLKDGDVVTKIDGKPMRSASHLRNTIASTGPGRTVTLTVRRGDDTVTLRVKLGELPGDTSSAACGSGGLAGLQMASLDDSLRERYDIPAGTKGVVVTGFRADCRDDAPAAQELREGDVILEVARKPVKTPSDVKRAWSKAKSPVLVRVLRRGHSYWLALEK